MNKQLLSIIADNPALTDTLKELFKEHFSIDNLDGSTSNEILGQKVRTRIDGIANIDKAFLEIARHKTVKTVERLLNPAR